LKELKVCTAYEVNGKKTSDFPSHVDQLRDAVPIYETLPGWNEKIEDVQHLEELPAAARQYLEFISHYVERPVTFVSVGPDRKQTILCGSEMKRCGSV